MAPTTVAVSGAGGYIGRPLVRQLAARGESRVKALTGEFRDAGALRAWLEPGCDVVHLVHLWDRSLEENVQAMRGLVAACNELRVRRLVHLSTVAVFGRVAGDRVDEESPCRPVSAYGAIKLALEELLRRECRVPYAVLRPTTLFGEPAPPLSEIAARLRGARPAAYLRSVLLGARRMNLVHEDNVAAAIVFLLGAEPFPAGGVFIVSQDDHPANNYREVERCLMHALGVPDYALRVPLPAWLLGLSLRLRRHNNVNPRRVFDGARLAALGFVPPVDFARGLADSAVRLARSCTC